MRRNDITLGNHRCWHTLGLLELALKSLYLKIDKQEGGRFCLAEIIHLLVRLENVIESKNSYVMYTGFWKRFNNSSLKSWLREKSALKRSDCVAKLNEFKKPGICFGSCAVLTIGLLFNACKAFYMSSC